MPEVQRSFRSNVDFTQPVCIAPVVVGWARCKEQRPSNSAPAKEHSPFCAPPAREAGQPASFVCPETGVFRGRLLAQVQADPEHKALNRTQRRCLKDMISLSNEGGEMGVLNQSYLAVRWGLSRRQVIRILQELQEFIVSIPRWRWVSKVSRWGVVYRMKLQLENKYRIATRFMSELKAAGKLIRRNVTAVQAFIRKRLDSSKRATESDVVSQWAVEQGGCGECCCLDGGHHSFCSRAPAPERPNLRQRFLGQLRALFRRESHKRVPRYTAPRAERFLTVTTGTPEW